MNSSDSNSAPELSLGPHLELRADDVEAVAHQTMQVGVDKRALSAIDRCHQTLANARDRGDLIYGLTTGFGPLAGAGVDTDDIEILQRNLVYHLATGTGRPYKADWARATMLCRASCLARGHSAVRPQTLETLVNWLNAGLTPSIPRYGSVGASGDLTPLAHMALAMMGEGQLLDETDSVPAGPILDDHGIEALDLGDRDGLALVNGTAAMSGLAALAQMRGRRALRWAVDLGALYAECLRAHRQAYDQLVDTLRPHPGQQQIGDRLRDRLHDSQRLVEKPRDVHNLFNSGDRADSLPQDPYSIRCIPQMLGAVADALHHHDRTVTTELNSVTDNPLFDPGAGRAIHAGNFFGQHIATVSDHLNQNAVTIAILAERQIARLTDSKLSAFPPFLQPRRPGVQSGLMGAQVTASSLVAELRSKAHPLAIQSMPTNADNQDVNPMGTLAALRSHEIFDRVFEVLAILAISLRQAHFLVTDRGGDDRFSSDGEQLVETLGEHVDPIIDDRALRADIETVKSLLDSPQ